MIKPVKISNDEIITRLEDVVNEPSDVKDLLGLLANYMSKYHHMAQDYMADKNKTGTDLAYAIYSNGDGLNALLERCIGSLEELQRNSSVLFQIYYEQDKAKDTNSNAEQKAVPNTDQQPISEIQH